MTTNYANILPNFKIVSLFIVLSIFCNSFQYIKQYFGVIVQVSAFQVSAFSAFHAKLQYFVRQSKKIHHS